MTKSHIEGGRHGVLGGEAWGVGRGGMGVGVGGWAWGVGVGGWAWGLCGVWEHIVCEERESRLFFFIYLLFVYLFSDSCLHQRGEFHVDILASRRRAVLEGGGGGGK